MSFSELTAGHSLHSPHADGYPWLILSILQMQALQAVPALVSAEISSIDLVSPDKIAIFMVDAFTW